MTRLPIVHIVTDDAVLSKTDFASRLESLAGLESVLVHVRARRRTSRQLLEVIERCHALRLAVAVNDRADLALGTGATAVHLPSNGLPTATARNLVGPQVLVGRSVHGAEDAHVAHREGADYVVLGNIWPTTTHPGRPGLGLDVIGAAKPARVIAIGGVTPVRAHACMRAGANGVAAIGAIWNAPDSRVAAEQMLLSFRGLPTTD